MSIAASVPCSQREESMSVNSSRCSASIASSSCSIASASATSRPSTASATMATSDRASAPIRAITGRASGGTASSG
jgi:hypothetical protein